jgi:hypothetical protein
MPSKNSSSWQMRCISTAAAAAAAAAMSQNLGTVYTPVGHSVAAAVQQ